MTTLRGYQKTISEATGRTDPSQIAAIEDMMRNVIFHSTLDWQSRRQFFQGAKDAEQVCIAMGDFA
jgi:hypothetical protein